MADDVIFTAGANSTPPDQTVAATDETSSGPHSVGAQMGIAKLAVSANGDSTHIPATVVDGMLVQISNADVPVSGPLTDTELRASALTVHVDSLPEIPAGNNNIGDVDIASLPNEGQQTMANSISVAVASDQSAVPVLDKRSVTGTQTSVNDSATSVTLKVSNANRIKILITNDSSARLYILFDGSAASLTSYSVSLAQYETWEELDYVGEIRGIWATDPGDGAARITEFT